VVELSGPRSRDLLAHGCALDLHPSAVPVGFCAQTLLAQAGVVLTVCADDTIRLFVRASFAEYVATWLLDAAADL
jgi:sarcosine oxidase subunit gamma